MKYIFPILLVCSFLAVQAHASNDKVSPQAKKAPPIFDDYLPAALPLGKRD